MCRTAIRAGDNGAGARRAGPIGMALLPMSQRTAVAWPNEWMTLQSIRGHPQASARLAPFLSPLESVSCPRPRVDGAHGLRLVMPAPRFCAAPRGKHRPSRTSCRVCAACAHLLASWLHTIECDLGCCGLCAESLVCWALHEEALTLTLVSVQCVCAWRVAMCVSGGQCLSGASCLCCPCYAWLRALVRLWCLLSPMSLLYGSLMYCVPPPWPPSNQYVPPSAAPPRGNQLSKRQIQMA